MINVGKNLLNKIFKVEIDGNRKIVKIFFLKLKYKYYPGPVIFVFGANGIGDYMLCRPYFQYLRYNNTFKNAYIIYCTRNNYADFTKNYDAQYFNEIIEIDYKAYTKNKDYEKYIVKLLNSYKPDIIISTQLLTCGNKKILKGFRPFTLIKKINAKKKVTSLTGGYDKNFSRNIFNKIIYTPNVFELERQRIFFEKLLNIKIPKVKSDLSEQFEKDTEYIAVSVIAQDKNRMYPYDKWVNILNYLTDITDSNLRLLFLGTKQESKEINNIINSLNKPERCINFAGRTQISSIPQILRKSKFLISVETGTVHIAHAVNCKTICLAGSMAYINFYPYSDNLIKYVYPQRMIEMIKQNTIISGNISVAEVNERDVIKEIDGLMAEK